MPWPRSEMMVAFSAVVHFDCFLAGVAERCWSSGAGRFAGTTVDDPGDVVEPAAEAPEGPEPGEISRCDGPG